MKPKSSVPNPPAKPSQSVRVFANRITHAPKPFSNAQVLKPRFSRSLDVGRWMMDVSRFSLISAAHWIGLACLCAGFAVRLSAGEPPQPSLSETNAPGAAAAPNSAGPSVARPAVHTLGESDLLRMLTTTLQQDYVKDDGQLELRMTQAWKPVAVPDEPLSLRVLDMPTMGVTPLFIARFELRTPHESLGTWQAPLKAWVWREIWVARSPVDRGQAIADAPVERERRDVLLLHEPLADFTRGDTTLELSEPLQSGAPVLARSVKLRPVVHRGQTANALVQDGTLSITMKVEVLEDAAPGQMVRIRNFQSRRDILGKVIDEHTILVSL